MGQQLDFLIYGYVPGLGTGASFVTLFSLLTLAHLFLTLRAKRHPWLIVTVVGGIGEIVGWAGRLWANMDVYSLDAFLMQQCALVIAPVFFSATVYCLFGFLIPLVSVRESILAPRRYAALFVTLDVACLVIQGIGGGMAGSALAAGEDSMTGTHIMLAGIVAQLVSMIVFTALVGVYCWRTRSHPSLVGKNPVARQRRIVLMSAMLATLFLVIRGIYRTVELAEGWSGYLITHEPYFIAFDAVMTLLSMLVLAIGHPAVFTRALVPDASLDDDVVVRAAVPRLDSGADSTKTLTEGSGILAEKQKDGEVV